MSKHLIRFMKMKIAASFIVATGATLLAPGASADVHSRQGGNAPVRIHHAKAFSEPAPLVKGHSGSLTRLQRSGSRRRLQRRSLSNANYSTPMAKRYGGLDYSLSLLFGKQQLDVEIDTGSSDLWIAHTNFTCYNMKGKKTYLDYCGFGELYDGGFEKNITNENFNIEYYTGNVEGYVGYEDITVGNLTVTNQEVAIAYSGYWDGDNKTAGLMGFAYPSITDAYYGHNYNNDTKKNFAQYDPFFFSAFKRNLIPAVFSMALKRGPENGYAGQLALGGLPDVKFEHNFTSVPIKVISGQDGTNRSAYDFYALDIDGWVIDGNFTAEENSYQTYIVDSGNDVNDVSPKIASLINSKFSPPAEYDRANGQYQSSCNATAPQIAVRINGTDFPIDTRDMLLPAKAGNYQRQHGFCIPAVQRGGKNGNTALGDPFLKNVVAVFDVGAAELRFAPHKY